MNSFVFHPVNPVILSKNIKRNLRMPAMFHFLTKPFAFFWNHLNPITVRELRRCNRPRGIFAVLAGLYLFALLGYTAAPFFSPPWRLYQTEIAWIVLGVCAVWAFFGGLATISASSRILALPDDDPLLKLVGMTSAQQVRGYLLTLTFYAFCATFLPMPFIFATMAAELVFPTNNDIGPMCVFVLLCLVCGFLGITATAAYFFSFYIHAAGRLQRFVASFVALFGPLFYYLPFVFFPNADSSYELVYVDNPYVVCFFWAMMFTAMFTTGYLISVFHFRRPFENFGWAILLNILGYAAFHVFFFLALVAYAIFRQTAFPT